MRGRTLWGRRQIAVVLQVHRYRPAGCFALGTAPRHDGAEFDIGLVRVIVLRHLPGKVRAGGADPPDDVPALIIGLVQDWVAIWHVAWAVARGWRGRGPAHEPAGGHRGGRGPGQEGGIPPLGLGPHRSFLFRRAAAVSHLGVFQEANFNIPLRFPPGLHRLAIDRIEAGQADGEQLRGALPRPGDPLLPQFVQPVIDGPLA